MANLMQKLPTDYKVVLEKITPLQFPRGNRKPLYIWRLMENLETLENVEIKTVLEMMDERGIACSVSWRPENKEQVLENCLRYSKIQQSLGLEVNVNANSCMYTFFNGDESTFHVDNQGNRFYDDSFGGQKMGCPFALKGRYEAIKKQLEYYLQAYKQANIDINFIFGDWEIDGPIEWNNAWLNSKKCTHCRENIKNIDDFTSFQTSLRKIRSDMQKKVFSDTAKKYYPNILSGNYGVYPCDGYRYWYDYFENPIEENIPHQTEQNAIYRQWYNEFEETGYTIAMPVIYTWYNTFKYYDFENTDYRWFYNMLKVASNAAENTPSQIPIVSFVHWSTTAPPANPDPEVKPLSEKMYEEILWHCLLRGHDSFFMWCIQSELIDEIRPLHKVYSQSLEYNDFITKGTPVTFDVPNNADVVISGLELGSKILVRRTDFGDSKRTVHFAFDGKEFEIPYADGKFFILEK